METWDGRAVASEPPFGAMIVVCRSGERGREWLLLHRAHHGPDYEGDWAWTPPSGARLPDEDLDECARRELREETGLELAVRRISGGEWALYAADAPPGAQIRLDPEHDRFEWLPLEVACARCLPARVATALRTASRPRPRPRARGRAR